jgi:DNA-binding SARP family transcriptional activator
METNANEARHGLADCIQIQPGGNVRLRKQGTRHDPVTECGHTHRPQTQLAEAAVEVPRLGRDERLESLERALAKLRGIPRSPNLAGAAVRELQLLRAEYLDTAAKLEAIARSYRNADRDLCQQITRLLDRWERQIDIAPLEPAGLPTASRHRSISRVGRLQRILRGGSADPASPAAASQWAEPGQGTHAIAPPESSFPLPTSTMANADVAARILGPLKLMVGGQPILRWNSLKAKTLFQFFLINEGRPVRRDVLMELQWPDHTYNSARNNLNVALSALRNTLRVPNQSARPIIYRDGCYLLNSEVTWWIDRSEFRSIMHQAQLASRADQLQQVIDAYQRAVRLYRGPLFEDDPAGDWFLAEQHQLKEMYLQALERLAEIYCDLGKFSTAVHFGQLATSADPCRESAHRMLMRCFSLQHQQQLVCREYQSCVTALHDELGVSPGDETVQLFRTLTSAP